MYVTLEIPGVIYYTLLGWKPPEDQETVIGISMVAAIAAHDPAHIFLPAARWHDACYKPGSPVQMERDVLGEYTWPRWRVDAEFHGKMLNIARNNLGLIKRAHTLHLVVRQYYHGSSWQGAE